MINRIQLRDELVITFTENELKTLSSQLAIPYDTLRGKTQRDRFGVLIGRLERHNRLPQLVLALVKANPSYREKYEQFLEKTLPGKLDESGVDFLMDISKGGGPPVEEPPTMTWDTQVGNKKDQSE